MWKKMLFSQHRGKTSAHALTSAISGFELMLFMLFIFIRCAFGDNAYEVYLYGARASVFLTSYFVPVESVNLTVYWQFSASSKGVCKGIEFPYAFFAIPCFFTLHARVFTEQLALSSKVTTMATCERKLSTLMMSLWVQARNYEVQRCRNRQTYIEAALDFVTLSLMSGA